MVTKSSGSSLHIGKTTLVTSDIEEVGACYSNFMQRIRLHPSFLPELGWYLMNSDVARVQFDLNSNSTTGLANLNGTMIGQVFVAIPPLEEQESIVTFLDRETAKIDALVAEQRRLIELLKEKRQAVISLAVTKGLDPAAPLKPSGIDWLGDVPEHWTVTSLKHIVAVPITDGPHETPEFIDEGVPFVSAEAVSSGKIDFGKIRGYISAAANEKYSMKYCPQVNDIYMVKSGATTGITAIVEGRTDFNIWSPLAAIRCKGPVVPRYILNFMRSRNFWDAITLNWSFGTQQNIGMGVIEKLACLLPPREEQTAIAEHLEREVAKFEDLMFEQERVIRLLGERRSALISAAVTGQIDVRLTRELVAA